VHRVLPAQFILATTLLPRRLWSRVKLPTVLGTEPFLIELLLLFQPAAQLVKLAMAALRMSKVILLRLR